MTEKKQKKVKKADTQESDDISFGDFTKADVVVVENEDTLDAADDASVKRVRKKKKKKFPRWLRNTLIVVGALFLFAGAAYATNYFMGQANLHSGEPEADLIEHAEAVETNNGRTIEYDGHTYEYNENIVSIAFIGFDRETIDNFEGNSKGQADALIIFTQDTSTGEVKLLSIPRDTMADIETYSSSGSFLGMQKNQICLAYSYGDGKETSCQNVVKSASRVLYGMPINYYFALDEGGIGVLNDAIGGVGLTPLATIPGTNIVEGQDTLLMGEAAYKYVQYRDIKVLDSALTRQDRQIQYVKAFVSKTMSLVNGEVGSLINLYNLAQDYSITNLGISEFSYLATSLIAGGVSSVEMTSLPGELKEGDNYAEYHLDTDGVYQIVLDTFYTRID